MYIYIYVSQLAVIVFVDVCVLSRILQPIWSSLMRMESSFFSLTLKDRRLHFNLPIHMFVKSIAFEGGSFAVIN